MPSRIDKLLAIKGKGGAPGLGVWSAVFADASGLHGPARMPRLRPVPAARVCHCVDSPATTPGNPDVGSGLLRCAGCLAGTIEVSSQSVASSYSRTRTSAGRLHSRASARIMASERGRRRRRTSDAWDCDPIRAARSFCRSPRASMT